MTKEASSMQKGAERNSLVQSGVDLARIQAAVREMLLAIGEDPDREGLRETPRRIAEMYQELFAGLWQDPARHLQVTFEEGHDELVIVKAIPFHSMCEHHFMPFFGVAHVGYLPRGRVVGISKIARVVEELARRPQLQERLAAQVADTLMTGLEPQGVGVVIEAEHTCMTARGVRKPGSRIVTSVTRGLFREDPAIREEFFALIGHGPGR
ncbi:MAG: GTP cyclohydrolase I FolE [Firmicutes bacterium]|nr:GTP cyclohydrolase I FolE [Bacillota bacterium]